jgi:thioredoxin 1
MRFHSSGIKVVRQLFLDFFIVLIIVNSTTAKKQDQTRGERIMASDKVLAFGDGNFETEVIQSGTPVLVDFWAPWCAPCKAIAPVVDALAEEYDGKIKVGKMNVDDNPATPGKYGVRGIPTIVLFKDGKVMDQVVGAVPKAQLEALIKKAL